jgi:hypothetical protein
MLKGVGLPVTAQGKIEAARLEYRSYKPKTRLPYGVITEESGRPVISPLIVRNLCQLGIAGDNRGKCRGAEIP